MHPLGQLLIPQERVISEHQQHDAATETSGNERTMLVIAGALAAGTFAVINSWISTPTEVSASYEGLIDQLHIEYPIPPLLDDVIQIFFKVHMYYKAFQFAYISQEAGINPLQAHPAIFGAALQLLGDNTTIGALAVNAALVVKCAEDILQEYRELMDAYQNLCEVFNWSYPTYEHVTVLKDSQELHGIIPPFIYLFWYGHCVSFLTQLEKMIIAAAIAVSRIFRISMCQYDAYLLFIGDTQARFEACTELVADWSRYREQLLTDTSFLFDKIEQSSAFADRIFERLGVKSTSSTFLAELRGQAASWQDSKEMEIVKDVLGISINSVYLEGKNPLTFTPQLRDHQGHVSILPEDRFPPWGGEPYTPPGE